MSSHFGIAHYYSSGNCSSTSSLLSVVITALSLMGLLATLGQQDVVLLPLLAPRHSGGVVGLATVPHMPLQVYANYAMGPPLVSFSFRVEPPSILHISMFSVLGYAFRCHAGCCACLLGLNFWGLHHCNPLELTHCRHICNLAMVISPHQVCTEWLLPPLL